MAKDTGNSLGESIMNNIILTNTELNHNEKFMMIVIVKHTIAFRKRNGYIRRETFSMSSGTRYRTMKSLQDKGYISYTKTKQFTLYEILNIDENVNKYLSKGTAVPDKDTNIISNLKQEPDLTQEQWNSLNRAKFDNDPDDMREGWKEYKNSLKEAV